MLSSDFKTSLLDWFCDYLKKWKKESIDIHHYNIQYSLQEQLFLRFLSLTRSAPLSLFWGFVLHGESRESDSWSSAASVCSTAVAVPSALFSVQQQQVSGTGCAARFKVWVWNRGARANRVLMALCSIRLFFSSGGSSSEAASKQTGFKQIGLHRVLLISDKKKTTANLHSLHFASFHSAASWALKHQLAASQPDVRSPPACDRLSVQKETAILKRGDATSTSNSLFWALTSSSDCRESFILFTSSTSLRSPLEEKKLGL